MAALINEAATPLWIYAANAGEREVNWVALEQASARVLLGASLIKTPGTGRLDYRWTSSPRWQFYASHFEQISHKLHHAVSRREPQNTEDLTAELAKICDGCHGEFRPDVILKNNARQLLRSRGAVMPEEGGPL